MPFPKSFGQIIGPNGGVSETPFPLRSFRHGIVFSSSEGFRTMRRLSCVPGSLTGSSLQHQMTFSEAQRRTSQQEMDSALLFLERRKSVDSNGILGNIQPDLYRKRGSVMNVASSKDSLCVGRIQLQLSYNFSKSDFVVIFLNAHFELKIDECHLVFSLGEDLQKESRKIVSGALIPLQTFKFALSYEDLMERTLTVEMVSIRPSSGSTQRHGRSSLSLSSLSPADELILWLELEALAEEASVGELRLCLQYLSSAQRLTLTVQEAVGLRRSENGTRDCGCFIKSSLMIGEKILKKRKSTVKKGNASNRIAWNEALNFDVDPKTVSQCRLEVLIVESDRSGNHRTIGHVLLPSESSAIRSRIWRDALEGKPLLPRWVRLDEG